MNAQRRKQLVELQGKINDIRLEIESLMETEQEYYDNMPESFQNGNKGEKSQTAIDSMQSAIDELDSAANSVDEATA